MAITDELKARVRAMAREISAEIGEVSVSEDACWLALVEEISAELGDTMATALVEHQMAVEPHPEESACPQCGKRGRYRRAREREIISRRGPATIHEPEYYCTCCRKSFFPDDGLDRG